ncbi:MAG: hypothetical protein AAGJ38_00890 [Planctomycetota bacterium]
MREALLVLGVLAELGVVVLVLKHLQRRGRLGPELIRKLLHVVMGLTVVSFPWLFESVWPVVLLSVLATATMSAVRWVPALGSVMGGVIAGVGRVSLGEIYFPIAVGALWLLSRGDALLFSIPILVLTLADATAALVGVRYGQTRYRTLDGAKSAEGSIAFFAVAFLSVHIPVLLAGMTGRAEALLLATIVGLLVMLIESIAWRGLDNLFVPLGTYAFLMLYLEADAFALLWRCAAIVVLLGFALIWRRRTSMDDSALLAGALFAYAALLLGGPWWLWPPLVQFAVHTFAFPRQCSQPVHSVGSMIVHTAPGLTILLAHTRIPWEGWLWVYAALFVAQLSIVGVSYRLQGVRPAWIAHVLAAAPIAAVAWLVIGLPVAAGRSGSVPTDKILLLLAGTFVAVLVAALGFARRIPTLYEPGADIIPVHRTGIALTLVAGGAVGALAVVVV